VAIVDISCGCFSGDYNTFDALRMVWSEVAGYGLLDLGAALVPNIDFMAYGEEDMKGEWPDGAPDDPLIILLVHLENEGRIKRDHCPYLADRLEQLENVLLKDRNRTVWLLMTQQFVRGLRFAAMHHQDVIFS
jgi:hypothetical protein